MSTNDAVGKKIVEALKKQSSPDLNFEQNLEEVEAVETIEEDNLEFFQDVEDISTEPVEFIEEPEGADKFEIKEQEEIVEPQQQDFTQETTEQNFQSMWNFGETTVPQTQAYSSIPTGAKQFDMPSNVAVLKKLITQLPTGVTKQTGAQIIKQTMEALGISMNTVLHEAQKVQDDMNESIKNCMVTIQEYKNNIKNLEKQGLDYQRQVNQLNDLISLFILSDKD